MICGSSPEIGEENASRHIDEALARAREILASTTGKSPDSSASSAIQSVESKS